MVRMTYGFWYTLCHAELVSASVRSQGLAKARSEILKQVIRLRSSKTSYIFLNEVWSAWHMESFVISTPILGKSIQYLCLIESNNSLLFANPVAVPRLPDAIYLIRLFSHGFKNPRLFAFGFASFRRLFLATRLSKPSGRRGLSNPWNKEVSIIKAVWKTGNLNSRRAFKPPDWIRTLHTMASGRREVK